MARVFIIVNAEVGREGKPFVASPATERMVAACQRAIAEDSPTAPVEIVAAASLWCHSEQFPLPSPEVIYCPLTIQLPPWFEFPDREIYRACRDIEGRRQWVEQYLGYKTSMGDDWLGDLWLPVVVTAKETLYGEIIGEGEIPNSYQQPFPLADSLRQPLYQLAAGLLKSLAALPAVYLLQFRLLGEEIIFDRLWPFPAAPAIASLGVQEPDLFACHWRCLSQQPMPEGLGFNN